jgi:hypothetical protein
VKSDIVVESECDAFDMMINNADWKAADISSEDYMAGINAQMIVLLDRMTEELVAEFFDPDDAYVYECAMIAARWLVNDEEEGLLSLGWVHKLRGGVQ